MSQQPQQYPHQSSGQASNNPQQQNSFKRNIIIALIGSPILAAIVTGIFLLASINKGATPSPTHIPTTLVTLSPSPTPNIAATVNAQATQNAVAQTNATATTVAQSLTPQYTLQTLCNVESPAPTACARIYCAGIQAVQFLGKQLHKMSKGFRICSRTWYTYGSRMT